MFTQRGEVCNRVIIWAEQHMQQPSYCAGKFNYFLNKMQLSTPGSQSSGLEHYISI